MYIEKTQQIFISVVIYSSFGVAFKIISGMNVDIHFWHRLRAPQQFSGKTIKAIYRDSFFPLSPLPVVVTPFVCYRMCQY